MKKLKRISALIMAFAMIVALASCDEEKKAEKVISNPTPQSVVESFYEAWKNADTEAIIELTCEPMWKVEAKSTDISVNELKENLKQVYSEMSGSEVYYKILKTTEYKETDKEYKNILKWAKDRYNIDVEGYAVVSVSVTYDKGEPVTEKMEIIKYKGSWYAKDLLGV